MNNEMIGQAREAATRAHAPYSGFRVGAVVWTASGEAFSGVNVENAAYPSSTCAEASAISAAVTAGFTDLIGVAVACIDATDIEGAYPCGQCRQQLNEFGIETVLVATSEGPASEHTLAELLPHGFKLA